MVGLYAGGGTPWFHYFSNASRLKRNKIYSFWSIGARGGGGIGEKRVIGKAIDRRGL